VRRISFFFCLLASAGLMVGCGGSSGTSTSGGTGGGGTTTGTPSGANVLSIAVNGGPAANLANGSIYEDAAFATATVCAPGSTTNCVTIDNLLVDTGSVGLRVFQSDVGSLNLPGVTASSGAAAYDCVNFVDGSYLWGPVEQADVSLGGETASSAPIQVISDSTSGIPASCSNGSKDNENTAALLGANGILGVGLEPTDCYYAGGSACDPSSGLANPPYPAYYTCSGSSCTPAFVAVANQVVNPVALFPNDNNGVIVELPSVTGSEASVTGSLVFGIGTESNNALSSSATVFTLACDEFTTMFGGQTYGITNAATCAGPGSFIDSGSNGLYFPNATSIPTCPSNTAVGNLSGFYCPTSTDNLSATNEGQDGASKSTSFSVDNAETLFTSSTTSSDAVFPGLAGVNPTGVGFDWGLPFFFGVHLYSAIDGQGAPSGAPPTPWWAY
jgi:hypothetical protein